MPFCFKRKTIYLDNSFQRDLLISSGLWRQSLLRFATFLVRVAPAATRLPGTSVPEDTDNEDIHWEHDEGALHSDHELLPSELEMTLRMNIPKEKNGNKRIFFTSQTNCGCSHWWQKANSSQNQLGTQIHGLLRGIRRDTVEHDAGQHGAQQQGKAAGDSLDAGEGAAPWPINDREPEVAVAEVLGGLHEKQIADGERNISILFCAIVVLWCWDGAILACTAQTGTYESRRQLPISSEY